MNKSTEKILDILCKLGFILDHSVDCKSGRKISILEIGERRGKDNKYRQWVYNFGNVFKYQRKEVFDNYLKRNEINQELRFEIEIEDFKDQTSIKVSVIGIERMISMDRILEIFKSENRNLMIEELFT